MHSQNIGPVSGESTNVCIENLHRGCENNALFLSRARRYFELNGQRVVGQEEDADLVLVGACVVTDQMRRRCEDAVAEGLRRRRRRKGVRFICALHK